MTCVATIDVGKSGCRLALWQDGDRIAEASVPSGAALASPDGTAATLDRIRAAYAGLVVPEHAGQPVRVVAGVAGLFSVPDAAEPLRRGIRTVFPHAEAVVTSDVVTSHAGALLGKTGVVLAAGTGVCALAVSATGRTALVDGWGYLLGDSGSGYAIGRAGLDQALRQYDGRGGSAELLDRTTRRYGDPERVPRLIHSSDSPAREVAAFAREVFGAAEDGDPVARGICRDAGRELAVAIAAAVREAGICPPVDISVVGGLVEAGEVITAPLDDALADLVPDGVRHRPAGDALTGAHLMAQRPDLVHHRVAPASTTPGES